MSPDILVVIGAVLAAAVLATIISSIVLRKSGGSREAHAELAEKITETGALHVELARANTLLVERDNTISSLNDKIHEDQAQLKSASESITMLTSQKSALETELKRERETAAEKIELLTGAQEAMANRFKVMAEKIMTNHGQTFQKQNKDQVEALLNPLQQRIKEFQEGLTKASNDANVDRATLKEQIKQLTEQSAMMGKETSNLTRALKGKAQAQGAWGEMVLATILEKSGLREGEEYSTQETHKNDEGSRLRPDVVVNIPGGQRVVIDSKVSLTAFEEFVNGESAGSRAAAITRHVQSMRSHIKTLGSKEYHSAAGSDLDYVVMFVPIEGALAAALEQQPDLTSFAADNNIAIATPTTLMIMLRTISSIWQVERRNQNAEAIAERAGKIYDKFVGFATDMKLIGDRLTSTTKAYDSAISRLNSGSGNLVRQVEIMKELGAKTSRSIPAEISQRADNSAFLTDKTKGHDT